MSPDFTEILLSKWPHSYLGIRRLNMSGKHSQPQAGQWSLRIHKSQLTNYYNYPNFLKPYISDGSKWPASYLDRKSCENPSAPNLIIPICIVSWSLHKVCLRNPDRKKTWLRRKVPPQVFCFLGHAPKPTSTVFRNSLGYNISSDIALTLTPLPVTSLKPQDCFACIPFLISCPHRLRADIDFCALTPCLFINLKSSLFLLLLAVGLWENPPDQTL